MQLGRLTGYLNSECRVAISGSMSVDEKDQKRVLEKHNYMNITLAPTFKFER